jgi:flagellar biosynthesis GTPase FlhF
MNVHKKLLISTGLLVSIGFGSAAALAQTATTGAMPAPASPQQGVTQPGAAPQAPLSPQLSQTQAVIQDALRQAQDAEKKAAAEAAERNRVKRELRAQQPKTPEERAALRAARAEARKKEMAEMTPEVRAAREKEIQVRRAQVAALRAAQEAQAKAAAAEQNAVKLKNDLEAIRKPNPARGADFAPRNVQPLLQGLDNLTKRMAAIKTPADLPAPQMAQLDQELTRINNYMDRLELAMEGVHRAGVQTPENKEAEALYMRVGDLAKALDAEMQRIEKLFPNVPQIQAMFAKFRD